MHDYAGRGASANDLRAHSPILKPLPRRNQFPSAYFCEGKLMSAEAKLQTLQKPEFTPKGEPNFNYTKTPNALVDELIAKGKLAMGVECIILLVIQRHTWGAEGKPEYFRASLSEIARACLVTPPGVAFALKRLETAGIIDSIPKGALGANEKRGYRLTPENWHKVKVYKDPNAVKPEKPKDAQPAVGFDADQPRVVALKPNRDKTVNIPITAQAPGEFDFPIRLLNEVDLSLAFALVLTKVGLDVIARRPADAGDDSKKRTKSERVQSVLYSYPSQVIENKQPQIFGCLQFVFRQNLPRRTPKTARSALPETACRSLGRRSSQLLRCPSRAPAQTQGSTPRQSPRLRFDPQNSQKGSGSALGKRPERA